MKFRASERSSPLPLSLFCMSIRAKSLTTRKSGYARAPIQHPNLDQGTVELQALQHQTTPSPHVQCSCLQLEAIARRNCTHPNWRCLSSCATTQRLQKKLPTTHYRAHGKMDGRRQAMNPMPSTEGQSEANRGGLLAYAISSGQHLPSSKGHWSSLKTPKSLTISTANISPSTPNTSNPTRSQHYHGSIPF